MPAPNLTVHCPHCSQAFDLLQAWDDEDARKFTALLVQLPPKTIRPAFRYLTTCFKPAKQALRWKTLLKLLRELSPQLAAAQIQRNGTRYVVPHDSWVAAMDRLVDEPPKTVNFPLKDHGYLLTMLAGGAEKQAGKVESKVEADKQAGVRPAKPILSFAELSALAADKERERTEAQAATATPSTAQAAGEAIRALKVQLTSPQAQTLSAEELESRRQQMITDAEKLLITE